MSSTMNKDVRLKLGILVGTLALWLGLDLWTKTIAAKGIMNKVVFIDRYFYLTLHHNEGIAFGIHFGVWTQIIVSIALISILIYLACLELLISKNYWIQAPIGIVLGGALGNLSNRIYLGYVIDFIYLWPIPVFNVADVGITLGLITLCFLSLRKNKI